MEKEKFEFTKHTGYSYPIWELSDIISEEELKQIEVKNNVKQT